MVGYSSTYYFEKSKARTYTKPSNSLRFLFFSYSHIYLFDIQKISEPNVLHTWKLMKMSLGKGGKGKWDGGGFCLRRTLPRFLRRSRHFQCRKGREEKEEWDGGEIALAALGPRRTVSSIFASHGALSDTFMSWGREGREKWEGGDIVLAALSASLT